MDTLPLPHFDSAVCFALRQQLELGLFRYRLEDLQTQILPGSVGFVAQLNIERGIQRRRPQNIRSVRQEFDPEQFNFNKIRPGEVLFRMQREPKGPATPKQEDDVLVVINVSPLEWGHVLLVPAPAQGLPQRLLPGVLRVGLEAVLLSLTQASRLASTAWEVWPLRTIFTWPTHCLWRERQAHPLTHLLQALPAPGFLFYTSGPGPDLGALISRVCGATDYLSDCEIVHNLFVTRELHPGRHHGPQTSVGSESFYGPGSPALE